MKQSLNISVILISILWLTDGKPQGISISSDNSAPDPSAILDVKSTSMGILFPRMSTAQRNAIADPADGLHIFNTTIGSLEYYDSLFAVWTSYCKDCGIFKDTISDTVVHYTLPTGASNFSKIHLIIESGGVITGNYLLFNSSVDLSGAQEGCSILIHNYGKIIGLGGYGGTGGGVSSSNECAPQIAEPGGPGGVAILSKPGTSLNIYNYGIIAGGGGGGGGGGAGLAFPDDGGGGGGGAGWYSVQSNGGSLGGNKSYIFWFGNWVCNTAYNTLGQNGQSGTLLAGGNGGNGGQSGSPLIAGYAGGNGGGLGQQGQNGIDSWYNTGGIGGQPGKAISGNVGNNVIVNLGSGIVYGIID